MTSTIRFRPIPTELARALRSGSPDAYGMPAERAVSDGQANPCRHCLDNVPANAPMLILAHRPFAACHPYAETGPIFLCGAACAPWRGAGIPPVLTTSPDYVLRGYDVGGRIVYGTGAVVAAAGIDRQAGAVLDMPGVAEVHVRSATNGCFQCRAVRAG